MKRNNEAVTIAHFETKLKGLSRKQKMQVQACFEASTRKGTNGMKFEQEWILECIVMHMKSPRLYEHIRKHKVMVVPSPSCLQSYIRRYKSGYGLSEKVLAAVPMKAENINARHQHGIFIINEIKLSKKFMVN